MWDCGLSWGWCARIRTGARCVCNLVSIIPPLPKQRWPAFLTLSRPRPAWSILTGLPYLLDPMSCDKGNNKRKQSATPERSERNPHTRTDSACPPPPQCPPPPHSPSHSSSGGFLVRMHPTLVSPRNTITASVAFFQSHLTEEALEFLHPLPSIYPSAVF